MPRVTLDAESGIRLSPELYRRCGLHLGEELLLEETETGLVLHPLRADVRKVYLEITTRCNLHCRTCVRNAWGEPPEDVGECTVGEYTHGRRYLRPRRRRVERWLLGLVPFLRRLPVGAGDCHLPVKKAVAPGTAFSAG